MAPTRVEEPPATEVRTEPDAGGKYPGAIVQVDGSERVDMHACACSFSCVSSRIRLKFAFAIIHRNRRLSTVQVHRTRTLLTASEPKSSFKSDFSVTQPVTTLLLLSSASVLSSPHYKAPSRPIFYPHNSSSFHTTAFLTSQQNDTNDCNLRSPNQHPHLANHVDASAVSNPISIHTSRPNIPNSNRKYNPRNMSNTDQQSFHHLETETPMSLTFLGTSAGGGPTASRSCSSLVLNLFGAGSESWMVDCAEGTLRQFMNQPEPKPLKVGSITRIFITHLHFDHCLGIVPLLANILRGGHNAQLSPRGTQPRISLYGPPGLRTFVRSILKMTSTELHQRYVVHELLLAGDPVTSCDEAEMHTAEEVGMDIYCEANESGEEGKEGKGVWRSFLNAGEVKERRGYANERKERIEVDAGCINHRVRCLGYVFRSVPSPSANPNSSNSNASRKIVILGDTSDASNIIPLAMDATLLVHEATDTFVPSDLGAGAYFGQQVPQLQTQQNGAQQQPHQHARSQSRPQTQGNHNLSTSAAKQKTALDTETKMIAKGHSTAPMAGTFARKVRARILYMNHISAKFYYPQYRHAKGREVIGEIERQASKAWGMGRAKVAYDFSTVYIPVPSPLPSSTPGAVSGGEGQTEERVTDANVSQNEDPNPM